MSVKFEHWTPDLPRRFRWPVRSGPHPNGTANRWRTGAYFPLTNLVVTDMGERGTGAPQADGLEWIDQPPPPEHFGGAVADPVKGRTSMREMLGRPPIGGT